MVNLSSTPLYLGVRSETVCSLFVVDDCLSDTCTAAVAGARAEAPGNKPPKPPAAPAKHTEISYDVATTLPYVASELTTLLHKPPACC